jgi:hypothetical protein
MDFGSDYLKTLQRRTAKPSKHKTEWQKKAEEASEEFGKPLFWMFSIAYNPNRKNRKWNDIAPSDIETAWEDCRYRNVHNAGTFIGCVQNRRKKRVNLIMYNKLEEIRKKYRKGEYRAVLCSLCNLWDSVEGNDDEQANNIAKILHAVADQTDRRDTAEQMKYYQSQIDRLLDKK